MHRSNPARDRAARPTSFRRRRPSRAPIRRTFRLSPRRGRSSADFRPSSSISSRSTEESAGADYIHSLLTGFEDAPPGFKVPDGSYYNPYFISGATLAMPPPLSDGQISYAQNKDESAENDVPETVDQYAKDVAAFLMWAAEPHLVERKAMGLSVMIFLVIFAGLVYYTKKKVWADVEH